MHFLVDSRYDKLPVGRDAGEKPEGVFFAVILVPGENVGLLYQDALGNRHERIGALVSLRTVHVHAKGTAI